MENLNDSLSLIVIVLASISTLLTFVSAINNRITQTKLLRELKKKELERILNSSDLIALGNYLDNDIGELSISDYVDNKKLTKKVDSLISRLTQFVGTEEEIELEEKEQEQFQKEHIQHDLIRKFPHTGKVGEEFDKIIKELYLGEPWNALARLRRYIEILLKNIGREHGLPVEKVYSVSKLIKMLWKKNLIESEVANNLMYPIHVSNKAVHGQELKQDEAEEAIHHAAYAIEKLINTAPNNGYSP